MLSGMAEGVNRQPQSLPLTEVQVDAKTGKIVSTQVETPKDQAKESAADKNRAF
jgi:hypothetical protein